KKTLDATNGFANRCAGCGPGSAAGASPWAAAILIAIRLTNRRVRCIPRHVRRDALKWLSGCVLVGLGLAPLAAHHVISAKFDSAKTLTLRGPITAIDWANPHAHLFINAADRSGRMANWAIELESP